VSEHPLLPPVDEETAPFWEAARRGELVVQRCPDTGRLLFPPRARSPYGAHRKPEWTAVSGRGSIWSFVVAHPPLLPYFTERAPYNVIVVALDEDSSIRLVGNLSAEEPRIGQRVRVEFEPVSDAIHLPRWVADDE
jgi:uncharacterized OB-fold protein